MDVTYYVALPFRRRRRGGRMLQPERDRLEGRGALPQDGPRRRGRVQPDGDPATSDFGDATVIRNATFRTTGARFLIELADGCRSCGCPKEIADQIVRSETGINRP